MKFALLTVAVGVLLCLEFVVTVATDMFDTVAGALTFWLVFTAILVGLGFIFVNGILTDPAL